MPLFHSSGSSGAKTGLTAVVFASGFKDEFQVARMPRCSFDNSDSDNDFAWYEEQQRQHLSEIPRQATASEGSGSPSKGLEKDPQNGQRDEEEAARVAEQAAAEVAELEALMESVEAASTRNAESNMSEVRCTVRCAEVPANEEAQECPQMSSPVLPLRTPQKRPANEETQETPQKRRRLIGKQGGCPQTETKPRPVRWVNFTHDVDYEKTTFEEFKNWVVKAEKDEGYAKFLKQLKGYGWEVCRNKWVSEHSKDPKGRSLEQKKSERLALRKEFAQKDEALKIEYAKKIKDRKEFLSQKETYGVSIRFGLDINLQASEDDDETDEGRCLCAAFCMLTYFDPKWSLKRDSWGLMDDIARFEELCQKDKYVQRIRDSVAKDVDRLKMELFALKVAYSLELCPKLFEQGKLQIHVTLILKWKQRMRYRSAEPFKLLGIEPQHVQAQQRRKEMKKADTAEPMFYYVQCPKEGMLFNDSNYKPLEDFPVNDKWLNPFLQSKKIRITNAIQELTVGIQSDIESK